LVLFDQFFIEEEWVQVFILNSSFPKPKMTSWALAITIRKLLLLPCWVLESRNSNSLSKKSIDR